MKVCDECSWRSSTFTASGKVALGSTVATARLTGAWARRLPRVSLRYARPAAGAPLQDGPEGLEGLRGQRLGDDAHRECASYHTSRGRVMLRADAGGRRRRDLD